MGVEDKDNGKDEGEEPSHEISTFWLTTTGRTILTSSPPP